MFYMQVKTTAPEEVWTVINSNEKQQRLDLVKRMGV